MSEPTKPGKTQGETEVSADTERRVVIIPAADWEKFEAWARRPPKPVPALRDLGAIRPAWAEPEHKR